MQVDEDLKVALNILFKTTEKKDCELNTNLAKEPNISKNVRSIKTEKKELNVDLNNPDDVLAFICSEPKKQDN